MPDLQRPTLTIRRAEPEDIAICAHLNAAYQTDYVWQMHLQEDKRAVQSAFTQVRLPRTMSVACPYTPEDLMVAFEQSSHLFAAAYGEEIVGCVSGFTEIWSAGFVVNSLIVLPQVRRKGVGKLLFKAVKKLAVEQGSRQLMTMIQTKNHPAIQFARQQGFVFCGYNDRYYPNGDIALIFTLIL